MNDRPEETDLSLENIRTELRRLQELIERERCERENALAAQEHRIIPAARQLYDAFSDPSKKELRGSAISAFVWCLVPSTAAAAGGGALIVSILTAALTLQQVRMMSVQNQQMSIQNALAEAQRRSSQLSELSPLLAEIENERNKVEGKPEAESRCSAERRTQCLRPMREAESLPPEFYTALHEGGALDHFRDYGMVYSLPGM